MFLKKQKKQILLTGAFFLALVFSFSLNNNLELNSAFAQVVALDNLDVSNTPSTLNNAKSLVKGSAGGDQCWFSFGCFLTKVIYSILSVCAFFAGVAATMFSYVIDVSHFQAIMGNAVIWEMWKIVRDFMNLFFIFVLLMSAFYTIFQVDKYSYKNILSKVVFGALFVNFSFPIARAIIDVGNVMMYSFINDIFGMTGKTLTSGILSGSGLMAIFLPGSKGEFDSSLELKFYFIAIICMFMFMSSFITLAVMMLVRMVMLPILVMFSPIGFVAGAIPGMEGYAKQWWDMLIKNVFFGPIAVFMMMIAVKFLAVWGSSNSVMNFSKEAISAENGTLISGVVYMAIPIIFFWIAITSAEKMSTEAAGKAGDLVKKLRDIPRKGSRMVGSWAGRKVESKLAKGKYTKFLSPTVVTGAFKAWGDAQKHEDMLPIEMAQGRVHNTLNEKVNKIPIVNRFTHKERTDHAFMVQNKQKAHYEAEIKERSGGEPNEDQIRQFLREGYEEHNTAKVLAATTLLSRSNGLDNIAGDFATELGTAVEGTMGEGSVDIVKSYKGTMMKMLKDLGMDDQSIRKHMHNFGENAKSKGDDAFGDLFTPDLVKGEWIDNPDHANTVAGNFIKMKAQTRQDVQHARSLFTQSQKGKNREYADLHESGFAKAMKLNADDVKNVNRKNGVVDEAIVAAVKGAETNPQKYEKFITAYNKNPNFKKYVDESMGNKGKKYNFDDSAKSGSSSGGASTYAPGMTADQMKIV